VNATLGPDLRVGELLVAVEAVHGQVPPPAAEAVGELTEREVEVISLVARGLTNADIAAALFLSPNSIKTYIRTAYRKMNVTSRSQAVLWAFHRGL
jgi:DNA-binding NarL/FixJ family response regulator